MQAEPPGTHRMQPLSRAQAEEAAATGHGDMAQATYPVTVWAKSYRAQESFLWLISNFKFLWYELATFCRKSIMDFNDNNNNKGRGR